MYIYMFYFPIPIPICLKNRGTSHCHVRPRYPSRPAVLRHCKPVPAASGLKMLQKLSTTGSLVARRTKEGTKRHINLKHQ